MATFQLTLNLQNPKNAPLPNLTAQVWIGDQQKGEAVTNAEGNCVITFQPPEPTGGKKIPANFYVFVLAGERRIYGEKDKPKYPAEGSELNLLLTIPARRADTIPLRLAELRLRPAEFAGLPGLKTGFVAGKLNAALEAAVQRHLTQTQGGFTTKSLTMGWDYTQWQDITLGQGIANRVLPAIRETRAQEIDETTAARLTANSRPVRELLHLDQPLLQNPLFFEEKQVLHTTAVVDAVLPQDGALADLLLDHAWDWERATREQWNALTEEGLLTEAQKTALQSGFALARFTGGQATLVGKMLPELTDLSHLATYDEADFLEKIQAAGGEIPLGVESPEAYAANLVRLAQRNFPSRFLLERKVQRQPDEGAAPLKKFLQDNPGFDLRSADFFQKNENGQRAHRYEGTKGQQEQVRQKMMSFQRVLRLADSFEAQDTLLNNGLDAASKIVRRRPAEVHTLLGEVLPFEAIDSILQQAGQQMQQVTLAALAINEVASPQAVGIAVDNYPDELKNYLLDIDGYAEMFGSQDYCECEHCKSIFGPAAYFVDLMKFVDDHVDLVGNHPERIALKTRRPDLWDLELTCENTNAAVPYLLIVNEIKQRYIAGVMAAILGKTPAEVDVWEQFARLPQSGTTGLRLGMAANLGNTWKNSFRLAFNRPYEESQILLSNLGVSYADILQALRVAAQYRMEQAWLGVSAEEWQLLVSPDSNLPDLRSLRFGFPPEQVKKDEPRYFELKKCGVAAFLRATSLSREDAVYLLSPKSSLFQVSTAVKWVRVLKPESIQEYDEWLEGLDNAAVLDHIHRLLRLQRHLPWTLKELDLVVQMSGHPTTPIPGELTASNLARVARIREVQKLLNLTVEEALALHLEIPNAQLYVRTVRNEFLNSSVEEPVPGMLSRMFEPAILSKMTKGTTPSSKFADSKQWQQQLQGLASTEAAFAQTYLTLYGDSPVVLADVSAAFRITRTAKALGLTLEELGYLIEMSGLPFDILNVGRILNWIGHLEEVRKTPLSLHEIWFITKGEKTSKLDFAYQGDSERLAFAVKVAQELMAAFVQDERLFIDAEDLLQNLLPPAVLKDAVIPIGDNLLVSLFFKKTAEGNFRIHKAGLLDFNDIPGTFIFTDGIKPIPLDKKARAAIADAFNLAWAKTRNQVFGEHLGLLLKTSGPLVEGMLSWCADAQSILAEAQANLSSQAGNFVTVELVKILPVLERLDLLFKKLELDPEDAQLLLNAKVPTPFIQLLAGKLPAHLNGLYAIRQLANYVLFKKQAGDEAGVSAYRSLMQADPATWIASHNAMLATLLGCEAKLLGALAKVLPTAQTGFFSTDLLRQMEDLVHVFGGLGIYQENVLNAFRDNNYAGALKYETALRIAFRAKHQSEAAYEKAWEPVENRIQELRRDVLCAFLLALDQQNNFHDTGDLYNYFLVDVEMSGCARVSRILEGILALQLYVHKVLMRLEETADHDDQATMDESGKAQWEWRKNYRVWEANRKVFLYPENWIEPELRDNKSHLFKALEDELLQQKISLESAESAYRQFLKGFVEVGQLVIAGVFFEVEKETYHIFGRTATDPYEYYYRQMQVLPINPATQARAKSWTPWEKVELAIDAPYVSPILHRGKMHLFWVNVVTMEKSRFEQGESKPDGFEHTVSLSYTNLTENGKWLQPQKVRGEGFGKPWKEDASNSEKFERASTRLRVFPFHDTSGKLNIEYAWWDEDFFSTDLFQNYSSRFDNYPSVSAPFNKVLLFDKLPSRKLGVFGSIADSSVITDGVVEAYANYRNNDFETSLEYVLDFSSEEERGSEIRLVLNKDGDFIFRNDPHQYLLRQTGPGEKAKGLNYSGLYGTSERETILLTTTVANDLSIKLAKAGLDGFLTLETQGTEEYQASLSFVAPGKLFPPFHETRNLDFSGANGLYFRELFFHIPFLIADHLNAEGKYKEADWWYRKVFDPTAPYIDNAPREDRCWQFWEFRNKTLLQLLEILRDGAAIKAYEDDPFNPHGIARLRLGAYQKSIVIKYVNNLLDWGDSLFRKDTWESNTEALMLYQLANDILGDRPQKTGACESAIETQNCGCPDPKTTYAKLSSQSTPPFIYYVENWVNNLPQVEVSDLESLPIGSGLIRYEDLTVGQDFSQQSLRGGRPFVRPYSSAKPSYAADFGGQLVSRLVFCIPGNEKLLDYWDRVADRLYKLRNCMNLDGVKRSIALFQPPIDPALLVAARASGLSMEDILAGLGAPPPPYRFNYLVEKAKAFAGTVQDFGGALLSALEKKDTEELTLLRSTQEQNLLKLTKEVKKKAVEEAKANLQGTMEGMVNVMNRVMQYTEWIEENLNGWERTQQIATHTVSVLHGIEGVFGMSRAIAGLLPQIGAPTAMKYGGVEISKSMEGFAVFMNALASVASALASSAGLEASFQRRAQDWKFQLKLSEQEIKQTQQQIASATIQLAIAEKDLEIHSKQIEQAEELHDFYKNKFTGLGLYNHLATSLSRLHRMAYSAALDLANQAESAYRFETDDFNFQNKLGNWDASRAGLLAGENLSLNLQKMEAAYLSKNRRTNEITQAISLREINPAAYLELRQTGTCDFEVPEWIFDLYYPGYYKRILKSVRLTIPCVVGPYANVACRLSMNSSQVRIDASSLVAGIKPDPSGYAASTANNDGGQFELNFRDERYLPFEGAGAVSTWTLSLPNDYPTFDYNTISDVMLHLSYTAKYESSIPSQFQASKYQRLISVKDEFPDAWYQLKSRGTSPAIEIGEKHLPYLLKDKTPTTINVINSVTAVPDISVSALPKSIPITNNMKAADDNIWLAVKFG